MAERTFEQLQLVLQQQVKECAGTAHQMEVIIMEYDHASLNGNNERMDVARRRYHDIVDLHLDYRSVIATLTREIENMRL